MPKKVRMFWIILYKGGRSLCTQYSLNQWLWLVFMYIHVILYGLFAIDNMKVSLLLIDYNWLFVNIFVIRIYRGAECKAQIDDVLSPVTFFNTPPNQSKLSKFWSWKTFHSAAEWRCKLAIIKKRSFWSSMCTEWWVFKTFFSDVDFMNCYIEFETALQVFNQKSGLCDTACALVCF